MTCFMADPNNYAVQLRMLRC